MTIIETFIQLRDDIKTWVTNNLRALNEKVDNIEGFSGDYNDLTNKPEILEDSSDSFIIADSSGNVILDIDAEGLKTTAVSINGEDVSQTIKSVNDMLDAHANDKNVHVTATEKATWSAKSDFSGDYNELDNKPEVLDDGSDSFIVADSSGNIILDVDAEGLKTTAVSINGEDVAQKIKSVNDVLDNHADNAVAHITASERTTWNNKSDFSGSYNDLTDTPEILDDASDSFVIADNAGNVVLEVDENGLNTTALSVKGVNIQSSFDSKVDKVDGKGLSTEDFTTAEKTKLAGLDAALAQKSDVGHDHDNVYYTETEVDNKLSGKSDVGHIHDDMYYTESEIDNKLSPVTAHVGNTDIHVTTDDKTRWDNVNNILDDGTGEFNIADASGNVVFKVNADGAQVTNMVVDGIDVSAKFDLIDAHTHNYAGSSSAGGAATSANKLNTNAGSATKPVYFDNGVPVAIAHTIESSVPSGAKFTDTTYSAKDGVSLSGTTFSNSGVRSISTGSTNGTISVNTNGASADVAIKGLGSAAYTESSAYDVAGTATAKADAALASAKEYADDVKNDLLNGAGGAYDTLKELGDLIDVNVDAIEALEKVAASKANASDLTAHTSNKSNPHGVTLAQLDVTATAAELNKLDGMTATKTELNYLSGVTSKVQTQLNAKVESGVFNAHTADAVAHVTADERTTWNNKSDFSGDYNDLTNAPDIKEDNSGNLIIADPSGNIIFRSDENGFETTTLTAQNVVVNGANVATEAYVDEELSTKADVEHNHDQYLEASDISGKADTSYVDAELAKKADKIHTHDEYLVADDIANKVDKSYVDAQLSTKANASHTHDEYLTSIPSEYVTETELAAKKYLTSVPSEYVTETELAAKGYATTAVMNSALSGKSDTSHTHDEYLTSIPSEYITETELLTKGYLTSVPSEYVTETELNAKGYLTQHQDLSDYAKKSDVPAVVDNLTSTSTTAALSAAQGAALKTAIDSITGDIGELGGGDMMKATYDSNNNGIVDNAEKLGGHPVDYFAVVDHNHDEYLVASDISGKADTSYVQAQLDGKSDSGHTHNDVYYTEAEVDSKLSDKADSFHGNHVPATETANNAKFLRNDNTWQTVTPENIGAATSSHNHDASDITSGTLAVARGGTGAATGTKNYVFATPNGSNGAPSFRALVAADIPSLAASKITSGTLAIERGGTGATTAADARTALGAASTSVANTSTNGLMSSTDKAKLDYTNIAYCTCDTPATTAEKTIKIDSNSNSNWTLTVGSIIVVKFTATNSADNPTFNVNGTGAKSVYYSSAVITTSSKSIAGYANRPCMYMYDGTNYVFLTYSYDANTSTNAAFGQGYGTCSTAAATAAKVVSLSSYSLVLGGIVSVKFTYAVPANATMNINSKGAKNIYYRGAKITAGVINAGDIATFIYDGTQYHLIANDNNFSTMTSDLTISKSSPYLYLKNTSTTRTARMASTSDKYLSLYNEVTGDASNNRTALWLGPETNTVKGLLQINHISSGTANTYTVLHTGNSNLTRLVSTATTPTVNGEINWVYE